MTPSSTSIVAPLFAGRARLPNWLTASDNPITLAVLNAACAALVAGLMVEAPRATIVLVVGLCLVLWPELSVVTLGVLIEESLVSGGYSARGASPLVSFGTGIYDSRIGGFRVVVLLVLAAAAVSYQRRRPRLAPALSLPLAGLLTWVFCLALAQGAGLRGSVAATAPFMVLAGAFVIGSGVRTDSRLRRNVSIAIALLLAVKALLGAVVYLEGRALPVGHVSVAYYDSAISFLGATAAIAAVIVYRGRWRTLVVALAGLGLTIFSIRRNVLLAAGIVLLVLLLLRASRRVALRTVAVFAVAATALGFAVPSTMSAAVSSLSAGVMAARSGTGDISTTGHLNDLSAGAHLVATSPLTGVGVFAQANAQFVVNRSTDLYIHDDLLEVWARFGLPAAILFVLLIVSGFGRAVHTLRARRRELLEQMAGVGLVGIPVSLAFFPYLSTALRYDIIIGVLLGLLPRAGAPGEHFGDAAPREQSALLG